MQQLPKDSTLTWDSWLRLEIGGFPRSNKGPHMWHPGIVSAELVQRKIDYLESSVSNPH